MPKYQPALPNGEKPYVVVLNSWGKTRSRIGFGGTPSDAKYDAHGRIGVGEYITSCRRATPEDMEEHAS